MDSQQFLTRSEWAQAAECYLGTSELDVLDFQLRPLGDGGVGFLGEHRLAEVTVQLRDSQRSQRLLRFFVKAQAEAMAEQKELIDETCSFRKEVQALKSLFVDFRSALNDGGEDMQWTCKCVFTRPDVIVLEDLVSMGFVLMKSTAESAFQDSVLVLRALAHMHAASLIFEETRPAQPYRLGAERPDVLSDGFIQDTPGHPGRGWLQAGVKSTLWLAEETRGKETARAIKPQLEDAMCSLFELLQPSETFRNVFCHADLWRNNIFIRAEGKSKEALLVDFQQVRYAPPAVDVVLFLHLNTRRAFRAQHCARLFAVYYEQLSENLKRHGLSSEQVLSWEEFSKSCEFYKKLGAIIALCTVTHFREEDMKHVLASSDEYQRFLTQDRTPEMKIAFKNDSNFREKYTEYIEEFVELCNGKTV